MRDTAKSRSCWRLKFLRDATVVLALLLPAALAADAIRLNGGQFLDGRIVEESDKTIIFETDLGVLAIPRSDIVEIERQGGARIPRTQSQSASPGEAALYSLIPFYSGFYRTRAQEFGVLPSLLQGYLAIQAILYNPLAWRRAPVTLQDHYLGGPFADPGRNLALPLYYTTALGPIEARGPAPQFFFSESLYQYDDRYIPIRILGGAVVPQKLAAKRWRNALKVPASSASRTSCMSCR